MSAVLFQPPWFTPVNASGRPYPGAKLYLYRAGTTTPVTVYADSAQSATLSNPVIANSAGQFEPVYLDPTVSYNYKAVLTTSAGVQLRSADDIPANPLTAAMVGYVIHPRTSGEASAGVTPTDYAYPPGDDRRYGATYTDAQRAAFAGNGWARASADSMLLATGGNLRAKILGTGTVSRLELNAGDDVGDVYIRFRDSTGGVKADFGFTAAADETFSITSYEDHRLKFRTGNGAGAFYDRCFMHGNLDTDGWLAVVSPRADNLGGCYIRFVQADTTAKAYFGFTATNNNDVTLTNLVAGGKIKFDTNGATIEFLDQVIVPDGSAATPSLAFNSSTDCGLFRGAVGTVSVAAAGAEVARFDNGASAGETRFMLYDITAGTLKRVCVGADDSGGTGYKVLRVPN